MNRLPSPNFTTTTSLVPWTAPEGATAHPSDSFQVAQSPSGGPCAATAAQLPNAPSFEAGTANPLAGAYSPFLLRLKREDGSQELKGLNVTLPLGLTARLAGTPSARLPPSPWPKAAPTPARAPSSRPRPSCPAASQLGTVTVGAGAGPSPFYAQGKAYLAGPYKGAPLSMLIVTPAVAGPFDLGSVAVRAALYVDPKAPRSRSSPTRSRRSCKASRSTSGSIAVKVDHPDFTLNPTSCEAKALTAEAIAVTGQVANLNNRFQVGGCSNLGFKPKLSLKLKGGTKRGDHPALTATLTYPQSRRLLQHRQSPGRPAAFGVPRHHPHQDDLHPRAVRRQRLPEGGDLRLRQSDHAAASTNRWKARSTSAPPPTRCPTWSPT